MTLKEALHDMLRPRSILTSGTGGAWTEEAQERRHGRAEDEKMILIAF